MDNQLENIYQQIPKSTCPPGCGECCGILWPSLTEIRNIKEWCRSHNKEYKEFHMQVGSDCPYLGEAKECAIYPVRPFLCRIMGASRAIPCPLGKCKADKLLNHPQSGHLYDAIYLKGKQKPLTEKHEKLVNEIFLRVGQLQGYK